MKCKKCSNTCKYNIRKQTIQSVNLFDCKGNTKSINKHREVIIEVFNDCRINLDN